FSCSFIHMTRSYLFMASTVVSTTSIFLPYTTLFRSVVLIVVPDPPTARHVVEAHRSPSPISMRRVIRQQAPVLRTLGAAALLVGDRKSTRLNSSHVKISYAVFCLKKKTNNYPIIYSL